MIALLLVVLASPAPAVAPAPRFVLASSPVVSSQEDGEEKEKPDKRPEIKEALKSLGAYVKERGKEDKAAIEVIDTLLKEFPESGPKDRKAIAKDLASCLKETRKPTDEGVVDNQLHLAAATALGRMGPESVKDLAKWVDHKNFAKEEQLATRRALILALGNTQHEDAVDTLIDLLSNHLPEVQAASSEALGQFKGAEQKVRKEIFKKMLDQITSVKTQLDSDQVDPIVRDRYNVIAGPMLTTLQLMSGQDIRDPSAFRTWWNKNKKDDWDEGKDG